MRSLTLPIVAVAAIVAIPRSAPSQGLHPPTLLQGTAPDQQELDLRTTPVVRAVQRAADSVVSIYILDSRRRLMGADSDLEGQGSGVIVDESGFVITNWHVVATVLQSPSTHSLQVRLKDDRRFAASVVSSSSENDLALLQLDLPAGEHVKPVAAGRSKSLMIGETVIAIGNPQGQANTVTVGVLSAIDRSITVQAPDGRPHRYSGLLQTDAAINQGNSGGALLDITGKLIGINNAMQMGVENIGFAIPVDTVRKVFRDVLLSSENLATVWLGMSVENGKDDAVVASVAPAGPADRAGLRIGDQIVRVQDQPVAGPADFTRLVARAHPGDRIPIEVRRDGRTLQVETLALSSVERSLIRRTGLELDQVTSEQDPELLRTATQAFFSGSGRRRVPMLPLVLRVRYVEPDSPAASIGVQKGDLILGTRVRDFFGYRTSPLASLEDLADRVRDSAGGDLFMVVLRGESMLEGDLPVRAD